MQLFEEPREHKPRAREPDGAEPGAARCQNANGDAHTTSRSIGTRGLIAHASWKRKHGQLTGEDCRAIVASLPPRFCDPPVRAAIHVGGPVPQVRPPRAPRLRGYLHFLVMIKGHLVASMRPAGTHVPVTRTGRPLFRSG